MACCHLFLCQLVGRNQYSPEKARGSSCHSGNLSYFHLTLITSAHFLLWMRNTDLGRRKTFEVARGSWKLQMTGLDTRKFPIWVPAMGCWLNCCVCILWPHRLYSPLGSSVHGILQARILDWVAMPFSRGSSRPRDWTWVFCIAGRFFTTEPPGKAQICVNYFLCVLSVLLEWCQFWNWVEGQNVQILCFENTKSIDKSDVTCWKPAVCKSARWYAHMIFTPQDNIE